MNCANHPETPVSSYCQNCGKPLCAECARPVGGLIHCEQCLAAKMGIPSQPGAPLPGAPLPGSGPNPSLATILGFLPGVGAMYNGQFVKAMIHVLVFVVLIAIAQQHDAFGIFVAAWMVYQVFDANQTAKARRDGLPLPDPFGLNELAVRIGNQNPSVPFDPSRGAANPAPGYPPPPYPPSANPPAASFVSGAYPPPGASYAPPNAPYPPYPEAPPPPPPFPEVARRHEPAGAIALIVLGMLFLFGTLGVFRFDYIERGWPILIIAVGVWLFYKRARENRPGGGL